MTGKPVIGITMGDAAGIGPEVVAKALLDKELRQTCQPVVIGDGRVMARAMKLVNNSHPITTLTDINHIIDKFDQILLLDLHNISDRDAVSGCLNPGCGKASVEYVLKAAQMALDHRIDALVTAPINKEATRLAGYGELGHLELLARYTHTSEYATILVSDNLRVVHLTTHYPLKEALDKIKKEYILTRLQLTQRCFTQWGFAHPVIGVAALNPHGGEGGIIGDEEITEIIPAVQAARQTGIDARGPYPADTIFNRALKNEFDVVLALYHDQGHIPIKVHNVEKSFSIAMGLPFIRTSVDHGTAFDIAWQGGADAASMIEAIRAALKLVNKQHL